jgi:hypothetical protein
VKRFLDGYDKKANPSLFSRPGLTEVLASIARSKNTAAGPDGIPFAAWRAAPELAGPVLDGALQLLLTGRTPPADFNKALLFLLPKKATRLVSDTRPISVTNTDNRLLASVVAHAIMPAALELVHPAQKGFLWGRNGADHTADINHFFFEGVVKRLSRFVFFLDTAKAFDSIDHNWIHSVLDKAGFPPWVSLFLKSALHNVEVTPFFGSRVETWIPILRGVKQGCPLSPLLFILAYDPLLTALSKIPCISPFAFADDLAIATDDLAAISPALSLINDFSVASGLGVNRSKSCVVTSLPPSRHPGVKAYLSSCPWPDLPLADEAVHLGIPIGRSVTLERVFSGPYSKALNRLSQYRPVLSSLHKKILRQHVYRLALLLSYALLRSPY